MAVAKKPFLRKEKAEKRGIPYYTRTGTHTKWQKVLQNGEAKFEILGSSHHQYVWKRSGALQQ